MISHLWAAPFTLYSLMPLESRHSTASTCDTHLPKITIFNVPFCWLTYGIVLMSKFLSSVPAHLFFPSWCRLWPSILIRLVSFLFPLKPLAPLLWAWNLPSVPSPRSSNSSLEAQLKAQQLHKTSPNILATLAACTSLMLCSTTTEFRAGGQPFFVFNKDFIT